MFTAIVWIGKYGSSSKGGFDTREEAEAWAARMILRGYGRRADLRWEIRPEDG